jgi:hypothetical protein
MIKEKSQYSIDTIITLSCHKIFSKITTQRNGKNSIGVLEFSDLLMINDWRKGKNNKRNIKIKRKKVNKNNELYRAPYPIKKKLASITKKET